MHKKGRIIGGLLIILVGLVFMIYLFLNLFLILINKLQEY